MARFKAVDFYAGVGGWSLGLAMAGIDVVASYELWKEAGDTNQRNNQHDVAQVDIRELKLSSLPQNIDIVVGSPPCTEFSFSNRGGNGDIANGLVDIEKFLTIVDYMRPKYWAMENVPRTAEIIRRELQPKGRLYKFRHLNINFEIVDMANYGLPQRRQRCIAGNFNFERLKSYIPKMERLSLGAVIDSLSMPVVTDVLYGIKLPQGRMTDHIIEESLNEEEQRINQSAKVCHPIYNSMQFPDQLNRAVRTITATCTRVSRESIIISNGDQSKNFRRLTLRERASLQGFPITFEFYGQSYSQKLRMIGNAIPPAFTFLVGQAIRGVSTSKLKKLNECADVFVPPVLPVPRTIPDRAGRQYPMSRRFRFAVPNLRLKSGVRFELNNAALKASPWQVQLIFGTSKSIHTVRMEGDIRALILKYIPAPHRKLLVERLDELEEALESENIEHLQLVWSRNSAIKTTHPFEILDQLGVSAKRLEDLLKNVEANAEKALDSFLFVEYGKEKLKLKGVEKLIRHAPMIVAGLLVGGVANSVFEARGRSKHLLKSINSRKYESNSPLAAD